MLHFKSTLGDHVGTWSFEDFPDLGQLGFWCTFWLRYGMPGGPRPPWYILLPFVLSDGPTS